MEYIAHIRHSDGEVQLLTEHLKEVQSIAETIGSKIGIPHVTGLAGMLHDMGKFSDAFQEYIRQAYENPTAPPKRGSVNHSTAGGKFLMEFFYPKIQKQSKIYPFVVECIANAIYSHHGQLLDMFDPECESPFMKRLTPEKDIEFDKVIKRFYEEMYDEQYITEYIHMANKELVQLIQKNAPKPKQEFNAHLLKTMTFVTKYIFSALIDADRQNSRNFEEQVEQTSYDPHTLFPRLEASLNEQLKEKQAKAIPNEITKLRQQMSDQCFEKAKLPTGIYTLSIPTGGGKTLASLRFALQHAQQYNKKRIIYIVPFTTIIEQNAEEVRNILKAHEYVLEHHSNVLTDSVEHEESIAYTYEQIKQNQAMQRAREDWHMPIVFSTMVQFLNTFYDGGASNTRRLHNLAEAIVIFDEVQTVPVNCVNLFNEALNFLKRECHSTIILCTATQPALEYVEKNIIVDGELIDHLPTISKAFKRTNILPVLKDEGWSTEDLAQFVEKQLHNNGNVLVILNTKKVVKALFEILKNNEEVEVFHLSTAMCPAHRKTILQEIREQLRVGKKIICISTQLIEAGVDVSFNCVIRSLAGLDSIAQAAGRCNRHGETALRDVYVINHAEEKLSKSLETIEKGGEFSKYIFKDINSDSSLFEGEVLSPGALTHYFKQFYQYYEPRLKFPVTAYHSTLYDMYFSSNNQFSSEYVGAYKPTLTASFKTAGQLFEVIKDNTKAILVPFGDGEKLIGHLTGYDAIKDYNWFMKQAQQYSVNVFQHEFDALSRNGLIRVVDFGFSKIYIAFERAYDEQYGLSVDGKAKMGELFI